MSPLESLLPYLATQHNYVPVGGWPSVTLGQGNTCKASSFITIMISSCADIWWRQEPIERGGASPARCAPGGVKGYYSLLQPCDIVLMLYLTGTWLPFLILPPQCLRPWAAGSPGTGTPCWRGLHGDHTQTWPTGSSRDPTLYCRQPAPGDFDEEVMCVHFVCVRWSKKKKSWEVVRAIPCWPWKKQNGIIFSDMGVHSEEGGLSQYLYTERDIFTPPILTNITTGDRTSEVIITLYQTLEKPCYHY